MDLPNRDRYIQLAKENEQRLMKLFRYRIYCVKGVELHYRASYATPEFAVEMAKKWANSAYLARNTYVVIDSQSLKYIEPNEVR